MMLINSCSLFLSKLFLPLSESLSHSVLALLALSISLALTCPLSLSLCIIFSCALSPLSHSLNHILSFIKSHPLIFRAGFILHSAIHAARPDIRAIIHIHHPPCVAVSAMKCGLLMVSQESALVGDVSYHDYRGLVLDPKEREEIAKNLGLHNKVLILRNHGMVTCGESLEEALFLMHNLVSACESQIKLLPIGLDNISIMSNEAVEQVRSVVKTSGTQVQGKPDQDVSSPTKGDYLDRVKKWKVWDLEFEAQMRMLDNAVSCLFSCYFWYFAPSLSSNSLVDKTTLLGLEMSNHFDTLHNVSLRTLTFFNHTSATLSAISIDRISLIFCHFPVP